MNWPYIMANAPSPLDFAGISVDTPDSQDYQMPLRMKVGDRRKLVAKAQAEDTSPTKWLIEKIRSGEKSAKAALNQGVSFVLDKRRQVLANELAKQLGFLETSDLAKDLLYRALDDPKAAEDFLFGSLRRENPMTAPPNAREKSCLIFKKRRTWVLLFAFIKNLIGFLLVVGVIALAHRVAAPMIPPARFSGRSRRMTASGIGRVNYSKMTYLYHRFHWFQRKR